MMEDKLTFCTEEVVSYLEDMIDLGIATSEEMKFYEDYKWSGKMKKFNNVYRGIVFEMRDEYNNKF